MKKFILPFIILLLLATLPSCDTNDASYYLYDQNKDGTLTIMGVSETYSKELVIPGEIDGMTVTAIGDYAFYNNQYIRKITLPDSIITIGECALADSCNLSSVSIGKNCETIGLQAFEGCNALETISLSKKLKTIKDLAFSGCTLLEEFAPPASLETIGIDVFNQCEQLIIDCSDCPLIDAYAKQYGIPTGFSQTDDFQILKIVLLTALALTVLFCIKFSFKKIKKSKSAHLQNR
jgi:hypothetical protein